MKFTKKIKIQLCMNSMNQKIQIWEIENSKMLGLLTSLIMILFACIMLNFLVNFSALKNSGQNIKNLRNC